MPGRSSSSERRCRKHAARYCSDDGPDIGSVLPFDSESPQVTSSTSVGDQWGEGPAICEGIPFQMTRKAPQAKAWALDGHGRRALLPFTPDALQTAVDSSSARVTKRCGMKSKSNSIFDVATGVEWRSPADSFDRMANGCRIMHHVQASILRAFKENEV